MLWHPMRRVLIRSTILAFLGLTLTGCGSLERSEHAAQAQRQMVGLDKEHVMMCMGPPNKTATEGSTEIWQYMSTDGSSTSRGFSDKIGKTGLSFSNGTHAKYYCVINVVITKGIVAAVHYNGPRGNLIAHDEQCGFAVEHCVE